MSVDDEGVGVPEDDRSLVTEPFHRAWNVRESRIPGTGLGLFICRRLVEAHGGRLSLGDRPDGRPGTRVTFTLPLRDADRRRSDGGRRVAETILIVEDEPEFAALVELWMVRAGYRRRDRPDRPRRRCAASTTSDPTS